MNELKTTFFSSNNYKYNQKSSLTQDLIMEHLKSNERELKDINIDFNRIKYLKIDNNRKLRRRSTVVVPQNIHSSFIVKEDSNENLNVLS